MSTPSFTSRFRAAEMLEFLPVIPASKSPAKQSGFFSTKSKINEPKDSPAASTLVCPVNVSLLAHYTPQGIQYLLGKSLLI